jgi:hypothetical protein
MRSLVPIVLLLCACPATAPPVVVPPDNHGPTDEIFADVVLGFTEGPSTTSCVDASGVPVCGSNPTPQRACDDANNALGPPDGRTFSVLPNSRIQLGFLCDTITETGINAMDPNQPSDDFAVVATVGAGALPIVEVSIDGTHYAAVNFWHKTGNSFDPRGGFQLEVPMWEAARFVRISNSSSAGTIDVDAVVALPRPM